MADDKHYVPGDFYRICDRTGFKVRAKRTRKEWNNLIVREQSWEPRHPQDFVTGVRDDQTVPMPRPRSVNSFQGPLTSTISVPAATGATEITIASTGQMYAGDSIGIILDNGINQQTTISSVVSSSVLALLDPLQWGTAIGNVVTDNSAVSQPNIG